MREMAAQIKNSDDMLIRHLAHMTADAMDVAIAAVFSARTGLPISTGSAVPIGPSHQTIAHPSQSMWHTLCGAWSTCFPISSENLLASCLLYDRRLSTRPKSDRGQRHARFMPH